MHRAAVAALWAIMALSSASLPARAQTAATAAIVPADTTARDAVPLMPAAAAPDIAPPTAIPSLPPLPRANTTAAATAATNILPTAAAAAAAQEPLPKWNIEPLDPESPFPMKAGALAHLRAMAANSTPTQDTATAAPRGFVVRNGTQFYHNGQPFYFVGGNVYWLIDFYTLSWGREQIEEFLDHAKNLGLPVIRTWMFNDAMPKGFARYDARQLAGLHYIIWAAKQRNIMLNMCLGNLWPAYKGPEEFLAYATGTAENKDVLDFYVDPAARSLYKLHVWGLISTVNPLTGLAPKDDPTIFAWNLLNEPRCPGCMEPAQQAVHQEFLADMAGFIRAADPLHLISASTEGFFVEDRATFLHYYNPGPGAQCDGEDWFKISTIPELDYTTVHVYERHMELLPQFNPGSPGWPSWVVCDWPCYINWFVNYVKMHEFLAANVLHKPLVIEEFGLTWWKKTPAQQRVLFKVAFDMLLGSAESGGALAGAMFWNAADSKVADSDGYNVKIDKPEYMQPESALPDPVSFPPGMVNNSVAQALTPDNRTRPVRPDVIFSPANAPLELQAEMSVPPPIVQPPLPAQPAVAAAVAVAAAAAAAAGNGSLSNISTVYVGTVAAPAAGAAAAVQSAAAATVQPATAAAAMQQPTAAAATVQPAAAAAAMQQPTAAAVQSQAAAAAAMQQPVAASVQPPPAAAATVPAPVRLTVQAAQPALIATGRKLFRLLLDANNNNNIDVTTHPTDTISHSASNGGPVRQLLVQNELDGFRRAGWRAACAKEAAKTWRPYKLFNLTDTITRQPDNVRVLESGDVVAIISDATAKLNRRQSKPEVEQAGK